MIVPGTLSAKFEMSRPLIKEAGDRVRATISRFCDAQYGFAYTGRVKTLESVAEKIETGRWKSWSELHDLFACTIIVPTLGHEIAALGFCNNTFDVLQADARGSSPKPPDVFRFDSTRLRARLRAPDPASYGQSSVFSVVFEIQIKTAFEHAWAVTTHDLAYKTGDVSWKRMRLAAQLKAAVEQLDTLISGFDRNVPNVSDNPWPDVDAKRRIATLVGRMLQEGRIPSELRPKDLSRFCDNIVALLANRRDPNQDLDDAIGVVLEELRVTPQSQVPRSISLLQYWLAIMFQRGVLGVSFKDYSCHITPELVELYPRLNDIEQQFKYDV